MRAISNDVRFVKPLKLKWLKAALVPNVALFGSASRVTEVLMMLPSALVPVTVKDAWADAASVSWVLSRSKPFNEKVLPSERLTFSVGVAIKWSVPL